ncbi:uncharacterized protein LOC143288708 [Babylonia areolata]|uniref:uncharacterized protein LOC143288708 n=1 Tax=Babylonia areolata TaxID=304850 RepID=UPI003FD172C9
MRGGRARKPDKAAMQQTDRGWAWAVLGASMGCNFLNGVMCYFVGVIHTGLLHKYQASVTTTAWVGALYAANMSLAAPIAAMVINRFGCRVCCVSGGLMVGGGFLASAFVPTIGWLFVTYGMIAGIGLGLTYSPSIISIGFYFDKLRGLATGISAAFAAIGILSGSLIAQSLIDNYSVGGAFMVLSAIGLHGCFFGAFFRPSEFELSMGQAGAASEREDQQLLGVLDSRASRLSLAMHGIAVRAVSQYSIHKDHLQDGSLENGPSLAASVASGEILVAKYSSTPDGVRVGLGGSCSILVPGGGDIIQVECEEVTKTEVQEQGEEEEEERLGEEMTTSQLSARSGETSPLTSPPEDGAHHAVTSDALPVPNWVSVPPADFHTAIPEIVLEHTGQHPSQDQLRHRSVSEVTEPRSAAAAEDDDDRTTNDVTSPEEDGATGSHRLLPNGHSHHHQYQEDTRSMTSVAGPVVRGHGGSPPLRTKLLKVVDGYVAVLCHKAFMCHCCSVLVANVHISGVYLHLPEYVLTKDTSSTQAATLFVAVGLFSLLSRLATGFSTTEPRINVLTLNMGMMGLCGLATIFFPHYSDTYAGQLVFSSLFGLYTGGQYALVSVIGVQFMGIVQLPTALGVQVFFMGVGYVAGPPLAALILDIGGTYQHSFIFLGVMMLVGSFWDMAAAFFSEPTELVEGEEEEEGARARAREGGTIIITLQDNGSANVHYNPGSVVSVPSRHSQDAVNV